MKTALAIRHLAFEDLGSFEDVLAEEGFAVRYVEAGHAPLADLDAVTPELIVVLGGLISAYEQDTYPFLHDELRILRERIANDRPTLGICLGAQLIAASLGARVYRGPQKEIGWEPLALTDAGARSALAELSPTNTPVLHWHGDTFELPRGAVLLASTPRYAHQAFAHGNHTLALQFHPEVTVRGLERWFVGHAGEIAQTEGISVDGLRQATRTHGPVLERHGPAFLRGWLRSVGL